MQASDDQVLEKLLRGRFSCRAYLPKPVPRPTIERILSIAQHTASWNNTQPWHLIITSGEETEKFRQALLTHTASGAERNADLPWPREYVGTSLERRRECGFALYNAVGIQRGDKAAYAKQGMENFRLFGAPHVAIVTGDEPLGPYGAVDCGAYVTSFMTAAQSLGVATIAQAAVTQNGDFIHRYFDIPANRMLICGISFGFADMSHPVNNYRTTRVPIAAAAEFRDER
ncbi:MAG: nitroreductase [Rhodospirillales bacterium]